MRHPIGNQSSQLLAVLCLSPLDHFIKEKLGIKYYGRYMDDFYLMDELYNSLFKEDNKDVSITVESADRGESQVR